MSNQERRRHQRTDASLPLKLIDNDFDILTETKNVSSSGVYCSIDKPIEPMTKLNMVILIPLKKNNPKKTVKKIICQGVVVRKEYVKNNGHHAYHIGIFFNDMKDADRKLLSSYLRDEHGITPLEHK